VQHKIHRSACGAEVLLNRLQRRHATRIQAQMVG
jgi:hypothetical protein